MSFLYLSFSCSRNSSSCSRAAALTASFFLRLRSCIISGKSIANQEPIREPIANETKRTIRVSISFSPNVFAHFEINKYSKLNCHFYSNNCHYGRKDTNNNLNYAHFLDLLSPSTRYKVKIEPHIHPIRYHNHPGILFLLFRLL